MLASAADSTHLYLSYAGGQGDVVKLDGFEQLRRLKFKSDVLAICPTEAGRKGIQALVGESNSVTGSILKLGMNFSVKEERYYIKCQVEKIVKSRSQSGTMVAFQLRDREVQFWDYSV